MSFLNYWFNKQKNQAEAEALARLSNQANSDLLQMLKAQAGNNVPPVTNPILSNGQNQVQPQPRPLSSPVSSPAPAPAPASALAPAPAIMSAAERIKQMRASQPKISEEERKTLRPIKFARRVKKGKPTMFGKTKPKPEPTMFGKTKPKPEVKSLKPRPEQNASEKMPQNASEGMLQDKSTQEENLLSRLFLGGLSPEEQQLRRMQSMERLDALRRATINQGQRIDTTPLLAFANMYKEARGYKPDYLKNYPAQKQRSTQSLLSNLMGLERLEGAGNQDMSSIMPLLTLLDRKEGREQNMQLRRDLYDLSSKDRKEADKRQKDFTLTMAGVKAAISKQAEDTSFGRSWSKDKQKAFREITTNRKNDLQILKNLRDAVSIADSKGGISYLGLQQRLIRFVKVLGEESGNTATKDVEKMMATTAAGAWAKIKTFALSKDQKIPKKLVAALLKDVNAGMLGRMRSYDAMLSQFKEEVMSDLDSFPSLGSVGQKQLDFVDKTQKKFQEKPLYKKLKHFEKIKETARSSKVLAPKSFRDKTKRPDATLSDFIDEYPHALENEQKRKMIEKALGM